MAEKNARDDNKVLIFEQILNHYICADKETQQQLLIFLSQRFDIDIATLLDDPRLSRQEESEASGT